MVEIDEIINSIWLKVTERADFHEEQQIERAELEMLAGFVRKRTLLDAAGWIESVDYTSSREATRWVKGFADDLRDLAERVS